MRVCVYCASSSSIDPRHVALATKVGDAIAARGWGLVSGGGRVSMMGAVATAVRGGGGHTIGVIPEGLRHFEDEDTEADELVIVPDMRTRKARMEAEADAFVMLPGGIGTLEEFFEAWTARYLGLHTKPVVVLDPEGVFASMRTALEDLACAGFVRQVAFDHLVWATDVETALDACLPSPSPAHGTIEA